MTEKSELGQLGEDVACEYLAKNGYSVLVRNYRRKWGEIDVVAKSKDETLVFFEVKTMTENKGGLEPEDQASISKLNRVKRTCEAFVGNNPNLVSENKGWRIDLLAVLLPRPASLLIHSGKGVVIRHYQNVGRG